MQLELPMVRLPVNVSIHVLALLSCTGALALLARLGALPLDGDIPSSFVAAAVTSLILLAPVTLVQLVRASRRRAVRPDPSSPWLLGLVALILALALLGLGAGIAFVTAVPVLGAALFWTADEPLPRTRLRWLGAVAGLLTLLALLGGGA